MPFSQIIPPSPSPSESKSPLYFDRYGGYVLSPSLLRGHPASFPGLGGGYRWHIFTTLVDWATALSA